MLLPVATGPCRPGILTLCVPTNEGKLEREPLLFPYYNESERFAGVQYMFVLCVVVGVACYCR